MTILASFIGINKHLDPHIRDLTDAHRDATALWALFYDKMPELKANSFLLEQDEYLVLYRSGIKTTEGLWALSVESIIAFIESAVV